jgi:multidrug efflux system membrane fusion protein
MPPLIATRFLVLGLSTTALVAGCGTSPASSAPAGPPPPSVTIAAAELRDVNLAQELSGQVEAIHHVDLRPRLSGYVTSVRYREGSEVAAGAVLFTIDARPYQASLAKANADLARARARAQLAHLEAGRGERLLTAGAIPQAERDTLASTVTQIEAEVQGAEAAVAMARLDVGFTEVRAPIAGRAGRALVNVGDYVATGPAPTPLTSLVSIDPVYVYFTGDEQTYLRFASHADQSKISIGLADEDGFPHEGVVDFVDSRVARETGTILMRAVVANPDKRLVPGLFARVRLPEGAAIQAIVIDDKAILTDQDRRFVYVLDGDTAVRRDVVLGRLIDGMRVITKGLVVGDRVIINGIQKVFPGSKATVAQAAPARGHGNQGGVP